MVQDSWKRLRLFKFLKKEPQRTAGLAAAPRCSYLLLDVPVPLSSAHWGTGAVQVCCSFTPTRPTGSGGNAENRRADWCQKHLWWVVYNKPIHTKSVFRTSVVRLWINGWKIQWIWFFFLFFFNKIVHTMFWILLLNMLDFTVIHHCGAYLLWLLNKSLYSW